MADTSVTVSGDQLLFGGEPVTAVQKCHDMGDGSYRLTFRNGPTLDGVTPTEIQRWTPVIQHLIGVGSPSGRYGGGTP